MRAPGIAAIVLGAVIALSGTLGVTYRSEAASLDDPVSTSTSDAGSAPVTAPDTTATTAPTTPAASDEATTSIGSGSVTPTQIPSPSESGTNSGSPTPADSAIPSDSSTPSETATASATASPSQTPVARGFGSFGVRAFEESNPDYGFTLPNSVVANFTLADGADSGDILYVPVDPETGADIGTPQTTCVIDTDEPTLDCTIYFASSPGYGLWHLTSEQNYADGGPETADTYVYIPQAPTISISEGEGGKYFTGTGIAGNSLSVSGSDDTACSDVTVNDDGNWSCTPPGDFDFSDNFTATQYDAGDNTADGVTSDVAILAGGISNPSTAVTSGDGGGSSSNAPAMTYQFFPGGIRVQSTPSEGFDSVFVDWYSWTPPTGGGDGESDGFTQLTTCPFDPDAEGGETAHPPTGAIDCSFPNLAPGYYNPDSYQTNIENGGEGGSDDADDYFVVPATPSITGATAASEGLVQITGTGVATDGVRVIVDGSSVVCSSTLVSAGGTWSCTTGPLSKGTHSLEAYDIDLGAGQTQAIVDNDSSIVYMTGGLSALSSTVSVRISASAVTPTPTPKPTATPTDFSDWFFTITGEDLNNVHPGDRFTVTGTGLPPGSTVSGELHSKAVSIGSAVVQPDGSFSLPVVVPADFPAGAHTIVMTLTPAGSAPFVSQQPLKVVPASASDDNASTPTPSDSPSPLGSDEGPGIDHHGPNSNILTHGLNSIADVVAHPAKVASAIEIGLVLLIFAVLPGHLLNATLAEQYERFNARRPKRRRDAASWWTRLAAFLSRAPFLAGLALTTVTALLFGFADPRFGFSIASLRLFLGLAIALAIVSYLVNMVTGRIMRGRWRVDVEVNLRPLGLILTVVGVVVSRLLDFSPGFLIGLVLGLVISEKHLAKHAWRAVLLRTGLLLGLALLAWLAFSLFDAKEEGGTFASELAVETLVAITTEAIVGLLVELLPLRLLEGEKLYQRSKVLWGALYLVAVFIFVVAVVPWEGNWAELGNSLWTWIGIVAGFGILATAIYIFFRVRSHDEGEHHIDRDEDGEQLVPIGSDDNEG